MAFMRRVSSAEMAKRFSAYCDMALNAPIVVTKNGRDRLVVLSIDEYNFLRETIEKTGAGVESDAAADKLRAAAKKTGS